MRLLSCFAAANSGAPWMDAALSVDQRTALLVANMTTLEKVAQLGYGGGVGDVCGQGGIGGTSARGVTATNALRVKLKNCTRLGIPPSIYGETTHSGGADGTTVFPMPCSQGSTWNMTLVEEIGRVNALQLRASGGDQALSPILQVCTDPRFGRMEENFGEDPFLVSAAGRAAVAGLQGRDGLGGASSYLGSPRTRVASQGKHYAMYGAGPKDGYTPFGGGPNMRTVFEVYLRPWRDFALAGGRGVMAAHNMIDWVPMHANHKMLTQTLRERFGLDGGYIGSDNVNIEALHNFFRSYAANASDAALISIAAGVDQDMPGRTFNLLCKKDVKCPSQDLDRAVSNIVRKKFASGLFDHDADASLESEIDASAHRALSRSAAEEGSVLLKNLNRTLPLDQSAVKKVAVVGPFGDGDQAVTAMLGGYTVGSPKGGVVTIAAAFKARGFDTTFSVGVGGGVAGPTATAEDFAKAVEAAVAADVAVVAIGTMACGCCKRCGNGEVGDRMSLEPEGRQLELLNAVLNRTAGTATKALLASWRSGEEGGTAIVNLLLGDAEPSGRLAQAWQRSSGYIHSPTSPWFQPHSSMTGGVYYSNGDDTPLSPLFPFGFGLSYTNFTFTDISITSSLPAVLPAASNGLAMANLTVSVSVNVTNTGTRAGATVVFVTYAKQTHLVIRNSRELAGFDKVRLDQGESRIVTVQVRVVDLARFDPDQPWTDRKGKPVVGSYVVDGGEYYFHAGGCVANPDVFSDPACKYDAALKGSTVTIGQDGVLYGTYL